MNKKLKKFFRHPINFVVDIKFIKRIKYKILKNDSYLLRVIFKSSLLNSIKKFLINCYDKIKIKIFRCELIYFNSKKINKKIILWKVPINIAKEFAQYHSNFQVILIKTMRSPKQFKRIVKSDGVVKLIVWNDIVFPKHYKKLLNKKVVIARIYSGYISSCLNKQSKSFSYIITPYRSRLVKFLRKKVIVTGYDETDPVEKYLYNFYSYLKLRKLSFLFSATVENTNFDNCVLVIGEKISSIKRNNSIPIDMTSASLVKEVQNKYKDKQIVFYNSENEIINENFPSDVLVLSNNVNFYSLLNKTAEVHTISSILGVEAVLHDKKVVVYGTPFYSGFGLTEDLRSEFLIQKTKEELFIAFFLKSQLYFVHARDQIIGCFSVLLECGEFLTEKFVRSFDYDFMMQHYSEIINSEYSVYLLKREFLLKLNDTDSSFIDLIIEVFLISNNDSELSKIIFFYLLGCWKENETLLTLFLTRCKILFSGFYDYNMQLKFELENDPQLVNIDLDNYKAFCDILLQEKAVTRVINIYCLLLSKSFYNAKIFYELSRVINETVDSRATLFLLEFMLISFKNYKVKPVKKQLLSKMITYSEPDFDIFFKAYCLYRRDPIDFLSVAIFNVFCSLPHSFLPFKEVLYAVNYKQCNKIVSASLDFYLENYDKALPVLTKLVQKNPKDISTDILYCYTLLSDHDYDEAIDFLLKLRLLYPNKIIYQHLLVIIAFLRKQEIFEKIKEEVSDDGDLVRQVRAYTNFLIRQDRSRLNEAFSLFREYRNLLLEYGIYPDKHVKSIKNVPNGNILLILTGGGPGDEINHMSMIEKIASLRDIKIIIGCSYKLASLYTRSFPTLEFIPVYKNRMLYGISSDKYSKVNFVRLTEWLDNEVLNLLASVDNYTFSHDLMADVIIDEFSFNRNKYLIPDQAKKDYWKNKLKEIKQDKKIIGLNLSSLYSGVGRSLSYYTLNQLKPILELDNVIFVSLEYFFSYADYQWIKNNNYSDKYINFFEIDKLNNFEELAAIMSELDYVIAVHTNILELAGALGCNTFALSYPYVGWRIYDETMSDIWHSSITHIISDDGDKNVVVQKLKQKLLEVL